MKNKAKYLTQELIEKSEFSEIDLDLQKEFKVKTNDDLSIINMGEGEIDASPIHIDRIIAELQRLKSGGATHVELAYHGDHIGYEFASYKIRKSTPQEVSDYSYKEQLRLGKEQRIAELYYEIQDLNKEIAEL